MATRIQRKQRTRQALMNAALELMENNTCFSGLSLREVTRRAGIVPAGFYRHFNNMEELGLALTDEIEVMLYRLIAQIRHDGFDRGKALDDIILRLIQMFQSHRALFRFLVCEQFGGNHAIRTGIMAIRRQAIKELAADMLFMKEFDHLLEPTRLVLAEMLLRTLVDTMSEIISASNQMLSECRALEKKFFQQLRFIRISSERLKENYVLHGDIAT